MERAPRDSDRAGRGIVMAALGIFATAILMIVGYRGTTPDGLAWIEGAVTRAQALRTGDLRAFLEIDAIFAADAAGALIAYVAPAHAAVGMHLLGLICGVLSTLLVGALAMRLGGTLSGTVAGVMALCAMPWLGVFSSHNPSALILTLLLAFFWLWSSRQVHPLGIALAAMLLALRGISWIGAFAIATLLVAAELLGDRDNEGGSIVRLDLGLVLIFGSALFVAWPAFWPEPQETLPNFFLDPLLASGPDLVYRGQTFPPDRPPLSLGWMWWLEATSPLVILPALLGLWVGRPWRLLKEQRLVRGLVALLVAAILLPWLARSPSAWGIETGPLAIAALVILSAPGMARLLVGSYALLREKIGKAALLGAPLAIALALAIPVFGTPDAFETTRYALPWRLFSGPAVHDAPARSALLPVDFLQDAHTETQRPIDPGEFHDLAALYAAMGQLPPHALTTEAQSADAGASHPRLIALPQLGAGPTWRAVGVGSAWRPGRLANLEGGGIYGVILPHEAPSADNSTAP